MFCESLELSLADLQTFIAHSKAMDGLQKLLSAQSTTVPSIAQKLKIDGNNTPEKELQKMTNLANGWLKELHGVKVEAGIEGICSDSADLHKEDLVQPKWFNNLE